MGIGVLFAVKSGDNRKPGCLYIGLEKSLFDKNAGYAEELLK